MAQDYQSEESQALREQALDAQILRHEIAKVAVWIADKAIYDFPDVEFTFFAVLQGLTDAI